MTDIVYYIDSHICYLFSKLGLKFRWMEYSQQIMRYVHRTSKHLLPESYATPVTNDTSNKIWVFWAQGHEQMPQSVRRCYESLLRNRGEHEVVLLDLNNYKQYVDIPEYIVNKVGVGITLTHFSDILRATLLRDYGGYWLDATIYVTKTIEPGKELFTIRQPYLSQYFSEGRWTGFLWYMPKGHPIASFLCDYLLTYWMKNDTLIEYLLIDYIIKEVYLKNKVAAQELDAIKESNPDMYFLQSDAAGNIYDEKYWKEICQRTQFLKTTWKVEWKREIDGKQTYYGKLL